MNARKVVCSPAFALVVVSFLMYCVNLLVLDLPWGVGHSLFLLGVIVFLLFHLTFLLPLSKVSLGSIVSGSAVLDSLKFRSAVRIYWVIACLGLVFSIFRIYTVGYMAEQGSLLFNLRYSYIYADDGLYGAQHMSLFGLCLSLFYAQRQEILKTLMSGAIYFISAISIAEKTSVLFLFVSVGYTLFFVRWFNFRGLLFILFCMLTVFYLITIGRNGYADAQGMFNYFAYGITAFAKWADGSEYLGCADLVFGSYLNIFSLGLYSCLPLDLGFSESDFNVMSYIAGPYLFGGVPMIIASMAMLGFCFSVLWLVAIKRQGYFLALLSCGMYALVMVFYAWQFSLTTYLYVAILLLPLFHRGSSSVFNKIKIWRF